MVIGSTFLVRLPSAYWAGVVMGWGISGIWIAVCLELVVRAGMIATYFASGRWSRQRI
jgi:Na+-driven multidrug efflux pump